MLYLQPCSLFGGAERQASIAIPLLERWGFDVLPLVGPADTVVDWLTEAGAGEIIVSPHFPGAWPKPRGLSRLGLPARYAACAHRIDRQVSQLIAERHIDLVFAAMPFSWVAATRAARRAGIPIVWRAGGTEGSAVAKAILGAWASLNPPDLLLCCGHAVRRTFEPLVPAPAEVVHNGVRTDHFFPDAADPGLLRPRGAELVVGFAGRLVPQKRPEDFLAMAAALSRRQPGVAFLVAGDGSRRPEYEAIARALGATPATRFLGYVADMRAFYAACDIFVLPSRSEGCPNVVLEAMAMRRALVVSDAAGTQEVLTHGREALVHRLGDVDSLTRAVETLIANAPLRLAMMARAHQSATRLFAAEAAARRIARVLRAVVAGRPNTDEVAEEAARVRAAVATP